jgi:hypothetical protein
MEHWLFSVVLRSPPNTHWYGYLMGQGESVKVACDELTAILEKICQTNNVEEVLPGDVRVTQLDANGVKLVHETVANSRVLAWTMGGEDPRAARLLALYEDAEATGPLKAGAVETACKAGVRGAP